LADAGDAKKAAACEWSDASVVAAARGRRKRAAESRARHRLKRSASAGSSSDAQSKGALSPMAASDISRDPSMEA
jgi:hypothetical protein